MAGKVEKVMGEYKRGTLHRGKKGPGKGAKVKSRKQAVAIALSEAREAGEKVSPSPAEKRLRGKKF